MRRRVLAFVGLVALALGHTAGAQVAAQTFDDTDNPGSGTGTGQTDDGFYVTAGHADDLVFTNGPGGRPGRVIRCEFWDVHGTAFHEVSPFPTTPNPGGFYELRCFEGDVLLPDYPVFITWDPPTIIGPAVSTDELTDWVYRSMTFEPPVLALNPAADQFVGVPTWLAVTSQLDYTSVSAAAGPVWATVRPEVRNVVFDMPNGDEVTCDRTSDMTLVWDPDAGESQATECTYTFTENGENPDGGPVDMQITATITWDLYRQTNLDNVEEWWTTHTEDSTVPITVRELQAAID